MLFSYTLIKKYLPGLKDKNQLIEALNLHSFEAEDTDGGAVNISIPTNRYSDAASHAGVAREAAAALGLKTDKIPELSFRSRPTKKLKNFFIKVKNKNLCSRYIGELLTNVETGPSPDWIIKALEECNMRSINNVVDVMNYVMLETGQPLHAFDADKIKGGIFVRKALKGEKFVSIDDEEYTLKGSEPVISDEEKVLAVAGIKGGKSSAVNKATKNILVESANFGGASVYKASREMGLITDASLRFSHNITPVLAEFALERAFLMLKEVVGVESLGCFDTSPLEPKCKKIKINIGKINDFLGTDISLKDAVRNLEKLNFVFEKGEVEVPILRNDVETEEDLAEEIIRLVGLNELKPISPRFAISLQKKDDIFIFNEIFRSTLTAFGYDEVYSHSFVNYKNDKSVEVDNFISEEKRYLRGQLSFQTLKNIEDNLRFFENIRLFEVGKAFEWSGDKIREKNLFAVGASLPPGEAFFELKGVIDAVFKKVGISEVAYVPENKNTLSVVFGEEKLGVLISHAEKISFAEIETEAVIKLSDFKKEFEPLPKYPSVIRDISLVISKNKKIGEIISAVNDFDAKIIRDVALIDEYFPGNSEERSITLRIVFRDDKKTLNTVEVNEKMEKITKILEKEFGGEIR